MDKTIDREAQLTKDFIVEINDLLSQEKKVREKIVKDLESIKSLWESKLQKWNDAYAAFPNSVTLKFKTTFQKIVGAITDDINSQLDLIHGIENTKRINSETLQTLNQTEELLKTDHIFNFNGAFPPPAGEDGDN